MSERDEITNSEDILDSRDIIARIEYLESEKESALEDVPESEYGNSDNAKWMEWNESAEAEELKLLSSFLEEFKGYGGDEEWRGDWYPVTLIRDSYFTEYSEELCTDIGEIPENLPWYIANHIDWEGVARELQVDYTSAEFDGVTYWAR